MIMNEKKDIWLHKLMGKFVILSFMKFFFVYSFVYSSLVFSLAHNIYLDPLYIYTKFQVAIMDFEFSTVENVFFSIETYS